MARQFKSTLIGLVVLALLFFDAPHSNATSSWNTPQEVSSPSDNSNAPQTAVDSQGNFITLFQARVGSNNEIRSTSSADFGATWSSPITISSAATSSLNPRVISVGTGSFVAVWNQFDGTTSRLVVSKTTNSGQTWSAPLSISTAGQNTRVADIAFDGQSSLGIVWTRQLSGSTYAVSASGSSDLGTSWTQQQDLTSAAPGSIEPQIASTGTNSFSAVWHRSGFPATVESSWTTSSGATWSAPTVASDPNVSSTYPQLVSLSANKIVATWLQNLNGMNTVSSSVSLDRGATWSSPVVISDQNSMSTEAQLLRTSGGTLITVWYQNLGSGNQILSSRSTNEGTSWSAPLAVSPASDAYNPRMASDAANVVTVAWWSGQGSASTIYTTTSSDSATSWAQPTPITQAPLFGNFVSIAVSPAGDTSLAWQMNYSGSLYKVYSSSYIVSSLPPQPQPQPNTLPPTGINLTLLAIPMFLLSSGLILVAVQNRKRQSKHSSM